MALTVSQVVELDVLRAADAAVLAGAGGMDRTVRWVHVSELPDIAYLLNGGELLLTAGTGVVEEPAGQRRFVRELVQAGCAGLVIELLRSFRQPPPAVIEECERCELPLIGLRREARFVEITERVHGAIINEQYALLVKADAIAREFTGLALRGGRLRPILERLAHVVDNPVILEDAAHQVVEYAARGAAVEGLLAAWERHSRAGHLGDGERVQTVAGDLDCVWITIRLRDELWGRLHVVQLIRPLDEIDRLALDRAAAAVGVALLSERDATNVADQARRALISDVLAGQVASREEFLRRARGLGADVAGHQLGALVVSFTRRAGTRDRAGDGPDGRRELPRIALQVAREAIRLRGGAGLAVAQNDQVFAIVDAGEGGPGSHSATEIAREVCAACARAAPDLAAVAGVSREASWISLQSLFEQADEALRYGLRIGTGGVFQYADLGIHHLLVRLRDGPELADFVESELAPLLEYDARSRAPLVPTLRAYLQTGRNKSEAARRLFIERRTLYRRLARISELLGAEENEDPRRWLRLEVAIEGLDVLNERLPLHQS